MPNDTNNTGTSSLLSIITRMLDTSISGGAGLDNIITVLSLLCLLSIMNRGQIAKEPPQSQPIATGNPLQKLLGDLLKGGDNSGFSPETLMSLLPLLNSPQLKSKLNPNTIGTVMGLINNLGGGSTTEKPKSETKNESAEDTPKPPQESKPSSQPANAAPQKNDNIHTNQPQTNQEMEETDTRNSGRYLNWKNNF